VSQAVEQAVKSKYGSVATSGLSTDHVGVRAVAQAFGYTPEELASIPGMMLPTTNRPDLPNELPKVFAQIYPIRKGLGHKEL
jgi:hypothetical protein